MNRPEPIPALTGLRIVGAVWVALFHFQSPLFDASNTLRLLEPVLAYGPKGVPLFFLLSGYIIWHNYGSARLLRSKREPVRFFWRRVARLWPVNVLALVLAVPVLWNAVIVHDYWGSAHPDWFSIGGFLGSAMMVQVLGSPYPMAVYPWNAPSWSLSAEMVAYLIFPVILFAALRIKAARLRWLCVPAALALTVVAYLPGFDFPYRWLLDLMLVFVAGVLLRVAGRPTFSPRMMAAVQIVAPVAVVLACYAAQPLLIMPFLALWVWSLAAPTGPVVALMTTKPMQIAGLSSYSLYMLHWVIFGYGYLLTENMVLVGVGRDLFVVGCLAAVAAASYLCWRFFETPARKVLNLAFERAWPGQGKQTASEEILEADAGVGAAAHAAAPVVERVGADA
ncbi:acyltransferase family protein [Naasia aerilata]|uniref:Acyltransferase n=1 Tax=Naasia aerilata TaxID=1162966 RepID=A0ABM8GCB4_9MICO|nr:acyltransferase [Naasia aerilata]BDZ45885.1 acyltransferase [Naasia aerilata]